MILVWALAVTMMVANAATFANTLTIPGAAQDATAVSAGVNAANVNRLGGFGSDIYYDRGANVFYGLTDRGPGGGTIGYETRVHKFTLDIDPVTGAASNFHLMATIRFTIPAGMTFHGIKGPMSFNGIDPGIDTQRGDIRTTGRSFDPEGFVVGRNGHFYVSDEYGPSIYEFLPDGLFVREFTQPENLRPRDGNGLNFSSTASTAVARGRQRNRGFEGLAISPDGSRIFALLQDPLAEEGSNAGCVATCTPAGRFSRNTRLIAYNTSTGKSIAQYVYQLEDLAAVNARIPAANAFRDVSQGANIGLSALTAISDHEFLAVERDNRGMGIDDPAGTTPVASKRIYRIDISRATDVTRISLAETNTLPPGVTPVSKEIFLDLLAELKQANSVVPEKIEGLTIGPRLRDGSYELLMASDNDFSVTQNDSGVQSDVCTNGVISQQVAIDAGCPPGLALIPTYLLSFKTAPNLLRIVP
jgi:hypothetical protein